jgi:hypothetical protein
MHEIAGQVHWHEPSGFKRAGFGKFNRTCSWKRTTFRSIAISE